MTFGDVMYWVVVGFAFIWCADILRTWDAIDVILERRGVLRKRA